MALHVQSSFTAGELDPALHERTTLQKYKTALATARNVMITKTGSVMSRPPLAYALTARYTDREVKYYSPPGTFYLIEWGHEYVRTYNAAGTLLATTAHTLTEDDLPLVNFETHGNFVYIFCYGRVTLKLAYLLGTFVTGANVFLIPPAAITSGTADTPFYLFSEISTPAGYRVDYMVTYMLNGEESYGLIYTAATSLLPINVGESNYMEVAIMATASAAYLTEMKVYRRPFGGGVFGYIGSSSSNFTVGANTHYTFEDFGGAADYTHTPPDFGGILPALTTPLNYLLSRTGVIYQQRLILTDVNNVEALIASRPGFTNNFMREYPLSADSALKFKAGSSGKAAILWLLDSDGLVAFTTQGIYLNSGALSPENLALDKKSKCVSSSTVPPIAIPGGVMFVDAATNTVRVLQWSTEKSMYSTPEMSIFSDHLFRASAITSWAFQEGTFPILWVTFDDGTFASFTYEADQEMRAWTRHDSVLHVEQVIGTGLANRTFFLVKKTDPTTGVVTRYVEVTNPRNVPAATLAADAQAAMNPSCALMDSSVSYNGKLTSALTASSSEFAVTPVTPDDWEGNLMLTCGTAGIFLQATYGALGNIFRVFDSNGSAVDLEVISWVSNNEVGVTPSMEFPSDEAEGFDLYQTVTSVSGLSHMEDEFPAVVVDGAVVCSPNNDLENYDECEVIAGVLTLPSLPDQMRGAIIHVGRPVVADIKTLDIDTIEQAPTLVESISVNKLAVKVHHSTGLYVGYDFPEDSEGVAGMKPIDIYDVDYSAVDPIIANRAKPASTKRIEMTLPGKWDSHGRVAFRQVDPLAFEILSIIPDVEVHRRSDR